MSDTPRTEAELADDTPSSEQDWLPASFVRTLERELNEARLALSKGSKWIQVGTPPAEGAHVLVLHENGDIRDAYRRHTWAGGFTTARSQDGGGVSVDHVTHWMPLPSAPEAK